jgi:hypothetical protein
MRKRYWRWFDNSQAIDRCSSWWWGGSFRWCNNFWFRWAWPMFRSATGKGWRLHRLRFCRCSWLLTRGTFLHKSLRDPRFPSDWFRRLGRRMKRTPGTFVGLRFRAIPNRWVSICRIRRMRQRACWRYRSSPLWTSWFFLCPTKSQGFLLFAQRDTAGPKGGRACLFHWT